MERLGGGGCTGSREVERLLLSFSKSTVNNAGNYRGRQNKRREGERREEGGKYCSPVPNKHQTQVRVSLPQEPGERNFRLGCSPQPLTHQSIGIPEPPTVTERCERKGKCRNSDILPPCSTPHPPGASRGAGAGSGAST